MSMTQALYEPCSLASLTEPGSSVVCALVQSRKILHVYRILQKGGLKQKLLGRDISQIHGNTCWSPFW